MTLKTDDDTRDMMCREIATLLGYDSLVASLVVDGDSLTDIADKWRVLDVWREALSRADYVPEEVIGPSLWAARAHLYGPLTRIFVSRVSISLTADPCSGRVSFAIDKYSKY
jgi:hypothetical protein